MVQLVFGAELGLVMLVWAASVYPKLWRLLIEAPADLPNRLTLQKVLLGLGLIVLLFLLAQTTPADIALLLASDALTYIEIAAAIGLAAANAQSRQLLRRVARQALRQARKWRVLRRTTYATMARVCRQRASAIRKAAAHLAPRSDDPEPWAAFA